MLQTLKSTSTHIHFNLTMVKPCIVTQVHNFIIYFTPEIDNAFLILFSVLVCNTIILLSIRIIYKKAIFLFNFLFYFIVVMLYFSFNQYIGFFFLIESTAIIFIVAVCVEMNFFLNEDITNKHLFLFIMFLVVPMIFSGIFYFNLFVYRDYYINYNNLQYSTKTTMLYSMSNILYSANSMYIVYISLFFFIVTLIIISFYKNYKKSRLINERGVFFNYYKTLSYFKQKRNDEKEMNKKIKRESIYSIITDPYNYRVMRWY